VLKMLIVHKTKTIKEGIKMNNDTKTIINNIFDELFAMQESIDGVAETSVKSKENEFSKVEMLTIKESAAIISGLSEHTVRKLVKQGKVKSIRTGEGKNGKILVNKADLVEYFNGKEN